MVCIPLPFGCNSCAAEKSNSECPKDEFDKKFRITQLLFQSIHLNAKGRRGGDATSARCKTVVDDYGLVWDRVSRTHL
jgi:hypothetical protein